MAARDAGRRVFSLHLIIDRKRSRGPLPDAVRAAAAGGVDWVQVREKTAPALDLFDLASILAEGVRKAGSGLLINDRVDVAQVLGADGVHLAKKSLPPEVVRPLLRPGQILGRSVHSVEEGCRLAPVVDYLTFGNVFLTESHPGAPPRGIEALRALVAAVEVPVVAIGGITAENVEAVLSTGCAGVAVIGAILGALDAVTAARTLRAAMDGSRHRPRRPFPAVPPAAIRQR